MKKQVVRLNESQLNRMVRKMVNESIRRIIKESHQDAIDYFISIVQDCDDEYDNAGYDEIISQLRSLESEGVISPDDYNYITDHWDEILSKYGY